MFPYFPQRRRSFRVDVGERRRDYEGTRQATHGDGKTRITWVLGPSQNTQRTRPQGLTTGISERREALRAGSSSQRPSSSQPAGVTPAGTDAAREYSPIDTGVSVFPPRAPHGHLRTETSPWHPCPPHGRSGLEVARPSTKLTSLSLRQRLGAPPAASRWRPEAQRTLP